MVPPPPPPFFRNLQYLTLRRAINHSEVYYPDPHTFEPRRFLNDPKFSHAKPFPTAEKTSPSFGWGRRICPGEHLATNSVFITIAKVCWAFNVRKYVDPKTGRVDEYDTYAYTDGGFNIRPYPFRKYFPCNDVSLGIHFVFCALFVREMAADGFSVIEVRDQERLKVLEREYHNAEAFLKVYEPYR